MEYFGTIFACLIAFWLGCVFGMLGWKKQYKKGYSDGSWDGMAKYLERYWEWTNKQKENEAE